MLASFVVIKFKASIENSENVLLWFLLVTRAILIFFCESQTCILSNGLAHDLATYANYFSF